VYFSDMGTGVSHVACKQLSHVEEWWKFNKKMGNRLNRWGLYFGRSIIFSLPQHTLSLGPLNLVFGGHRW
jgi:hypothetical protein